jgi:uncharacterized membrane protein
MTIEPGPASAPSDSGKNMALVLYILSLAGFLTGGLTSLVALIIGLVKKDEYRGTIYESHFEFANMSNIWGLVGCIIGTILLFLLIGFLVLPLVAIWYLVRLVVGLMKLMENKPIDNPRTLLI